MTIEELVERIKPLIVEYEIYDLKREEVQHIVEQILDLKAQEEGYASFFDKVVFEELKRIELFPSVEYNKKEEYLWKDLRFGAMADVEAMGQISLLGRLGLL